MTSVSVGSVMSATKGVSQFAVLRSPFAVLWMVTMETPCVSRLVVKLASGAISIATCGLGVCVHVYKVCWKRGVLEGIGRALVPWRPHESLPSVATVFCDAARQWSVYYAGQWGDERGMRIKRPPEWVVTQHAAKPGGVVDTVKLCACRGHGYL